MKNNIGFLQLVKFLIFILLIYYLYTTVPWREVNDVIFSASVDMLILAIIMQIASVLIISARWWMLLRKGAEVKLQSALKIGYIGTMFNNFMPSSIGGDFVRAYYISKIGVSLNKAINSLIVDRVMGLFFLLIFSFVFLIIYRNITYIPSYIENTVILSLFGLFVLILIAKSSKLIAVSNSILIKSFLSADNRQRVSSSIIEFQKNIPKNVVFLIMFLMSFFLLLVETTVFWLIALSLDIIYPFYVFVIAVPIITIIAALPISFGGLIMREAAGIVILEMMGVTVAEASLIVILFIPVLIISSIPGFYLYLKSDKVTKSIK